MTDTDPQQIKVLLADDSEFMLRAVARLLGSTSQVVLVGAAVDFAEAVRMAAEQKPHVIVLDLHMVQQNTGDALRLKAESAIRILAITAANVNDEASLALARAIGADRLLDKMNLEEELILAIQEVTSDQKTNG